MKGLRKGIAFLISGLLLISAMAVPAFATDEDVVAAALADITLPADTVTADFALPLSDGDVSFSWASSDESSILPVGGTAYVLPDLTAKTTTLTVTASKGTAADSREIPVKVGTYTYTGAGFINENFDSEALDANIWQRDKNQIADDANNFMGVAAEAEADSEGYDSKNKVYKIKRNSTSKSPSLIHVNLANEQNPLPENSRIIYETRVRAEAQPTRVSDSAGVMTDFWWYQATGNEYGKYGGFATAYVGANKITVKPSKDGETVSATKPLTDKEWKKFVFDVKSAEGIFDFYLDGEHLADDYKMRANGAPLKRLMFGFNSDKNGELWMDDVKIYLYPKTASELLKDASFGVTDLGAVDQNLTLPAVSEGTVTWVSDKPEILDNTGAVDQSAVTGESETVNLYAIVNNSGVKTVQKYEVTVNKEVKVPSELDDLDINEIVGDQPADALVKGFTLPAQTAGGTQITWTSSDASVIEIVNGTQAVIKPGDALKNAALTAEITVNGQKISRVFPLGVAAAGPMDAELDINEIVGQDLSDIQADFTLPEETKSGYPVTWESSLPESLFVHGGKAYVIRQIDPTDVTLSALIVKDGVENRVDYKLTIGKAPEVTSFLVNENFENIEVGKLPENTAVNQWGKDASISDDNPNIDIGVQQENETNKVLNVHHIEADGNQHGMMHLSFNAPKRGTIAVEYRYRYVVTDGGTPAKNTNANVWVNQTTGHTVAPSGNFVRLPFNDGFVVAQLGGSISERMNYANGNWHTMKAWLDLDQGLVTAYVDDQVLCKDAPKFQGDGAMRLQIGFDSANRGRCQLDDIKIYIDPVSVVTNYAKSIDLGDLSAVMKDLEIPDKTPLGDADIMWVSSNPEVISTTGKVNHPTDKDSVSVTLWALVENEGNRSLRTFNAIVPRLKTDEESVALDFADLNLATAGLLLADELHLPTVGAQGSTITWSSSHPAIIANDGKVSRIPYDTEKITEVTLTATVSKGNAAAKSKTFTFRVPERNYVLDATVTGSSSLGNKRFEFIKDNDSTTAWAPSADDKEQTLTITLPKAKMVNMIKVNGSCGSVSMSYQTEGNNTYQRLGSGMAVEFSPKLVKTVKFEFTDVEEISSIGIYYTLTDQEAVEKDMEALNLGDLNSVTSNIKIPTVGAVCGSKITAKSSDTRYLSDKGAVTRPSASEGDVDVVLTLTFTFGNYSVSKDYTVHILKNTSGGSGGGSGSGSSHAGGGSGTPNVAPPVTNPDNGGTQDAFPDIKDITWAKAAINNFAAKGFINGNEAGNFEPDRMISREEFLKMVLNAFGLKTGGATCDFADVPEDSWYYGYVATAYQLGIVNGIGDGKFGSGQPILRCDMAVMIQKAAEAANLNRNAGVEKQFADEADIPAYAIESVKNLSGLGVINGFEDNTFRPADEASRAQAVVMLYNYLNRK